MYTLRIKILLLPVFALFLLTFSCKKETYKQYAPEVNGWTTYTEADGVLAKYIRCMAVDSAQNIWACTDYSVLKYNGTGWSKIRIPDSLGFGLVSGITFDKKGNVWISSDHSGVGKYDGSQWTKFCDANSGIASDYANCICADQYDNIWVGTSDSGVSIYDGNTWQNYNTNNSPITYDLIHCIVIDKKNTGWVGTAYGLASFDGVDWIQIPGFRESIISICFDKDENLYCGFDAYETSGVYFYDRKAWNPLSVLNDSIVVSTVTSVSVDLNNKLWIGTRDGLYGYVNNEITHFEALTNSGLLSPYVYSVIADKKGNIWMIDFGKICKYSGQ